MKALTRIFTISVVFFMATSFLIAQSQIQFEGLYSEGEGAAAWDADGSGPEPYGNGHGTIYYYLASRDYVDPGSSSGAHMLNNMTGFPLLEQALTNNGFTAEQISLKISLSSMGEDIEGIDWFQLGATHYANFYPAHCTFQLDGELLFEAIGNYAIYISGPDTRGFETGFLKINNISANSPDLVKNVATALLADLGNEELKLYMQVTDAALLSGNSRSGGYFNITGTLEKGLPILPFKGLNADHEGFAGWDADGSGPEPEANGHNTQLYYGASIDYDSIDPDPDACFGHFLDGSSGFFNTLVQLQYRGFEIGDIKLKLGLNSLGPDVEGEDWGNGWSNYYNNSLTIELDGEPILTMLADTNKLASMGSYWMSGSSIGKVYDISENASSEAQFVAQSFLKDMDTHYLKMDNEETHYVSLFNGAGRDGAIYEITAASLVGVHENATFIPEGEVSGTWTVDNSPYYVEGHLSIEDGQTLTINPGVKVAVRGPYHFTVQGNIKALGASDNNIIFTSSNPNLYWDGFDFDEPSPTSDARFDWCLFQFGYAQGEGEALNSGGIFAVKDFDSLTILNSTFRHNLADIDGNRPPSGGAIALWNASPMIQKCIFYDNYANDYGGAILSYAESNPIISNCLFYNNYSNRGGAIAFYDHSQSILINNTIVDNTALMGGGLYFFWQSNPEIINTILWGNEATSSGNQVYSSSLSSSPDFYYCDIEEGQAGFGGTAINGAYLFNIEEHPEFMDEPPYAIPGESPCFNMGASDTSAWHYPDYLSTTCLCGNPRVCFNRIDMGAHEYFNVGIDQANPTKIIITAQPNPFRNSTQIVFELAEAANVKIEIYNAIGSKIATLEDGFLLQGKHQTTLNNHNLPEGIYFCRLQAGGEVIVEKIIKN